jgi:hypothetical protein
VNEQLQAKMIEILTGIQNATRAAGDFALEQLPEIAQSYVLYGRVQTLIDLAFALAVAVAGGLLLRAVVAHVNKAGGFINSEPAFVIFGSMSGVALALFGCVSAFRAASSSALVWLAPKVWLIKELAGLMK